jgi:hypothetical protein
VLSWGGLPQWCGACAVDQPICTMTEQFIPDDITRFVADKIDSVAQLEAVLLLRSDPNKEWTVTALAARLYINEAQTGELLVALCTEGLVAARQDASVYRYQPRTTELGQMLDRVAEVYAKQLVAITNLIHSKQKPRVQAFADAFRLRKDD